MHEFKSDFYGYNMKSLILGYIRPELQYTSRGAIVLFTCSTCTDEFSLTEALIEDIEFDKKVALKSLARSGYEMYMSDPFFTVQRLKTPNTSEV